MARLKKLMDTFHKDTRGATAVEYAMIVGAIAVGTLVALNALRDRIVVLFNGILPSG